MAILQRYTALGNIALIEFADVILRARIMKLPTGTPLKLRLEIVDG